MTPPTATGIAATSVPAPLVDLRHVTARGRILAAFERSAYLDVDGRLIALASADLATGPLTIGIEDFGPLRALAPGTDVMLAGGLLRVDGVAVDLRTGSVWDPALAVGSDAPVAVAPVARDAAIDELLGGAPDGSIAPLLRPMPSTGADLQTAAHAAVLTALNRGLDALAALFSGRMRSAEVAQIIGRDVAGRGPGLTPSGDDLLIGIVHALSVWPRLAGASAPEVRELIVAAARPRTTRISAAYLDAAGRGWAAEPWHALVRSFREPPASTRAAVRRLLRIGETSGADALTGFCWAWRRAQE